jgi:hypothetical protein
MRRFSLLTLSVLMVGCSSGLKEVGFAVPDHQNGAHYIVNRSLVNDRFTSNQPHTAGQFYCHYKYTSVEMAKLRLQFGDHTWYYGCSPIDEHSEHKYALTSDQSNASLLQGPVSAAILGGSIGAGLAFSGSDTTVNQTGGGASASSSATSNAGGKGVKVPSKKW